MAYGDSLFAIRDTRKSMSSANVRNIQALADLKAALARFKSDALAPIHAAQQELERAQEWLAERERHWRRQVQQGEQVVQQAQATLARCQASGYRDQQGRYYPPNCSAEERAVAHAQQQLRQARAELESVQLAVRAVQQQAASFQRQAQLLKAALENDVAKATALLERKIAILLGYVGDSAPTAEEISAAVSAVAATAAASAYEFAKLATDANAQFKDGKILVNERYRGVGAKELLEPLLAHEQVHARYQSAAPHDEASLHEYTDEEMEAYKAQYDAWLKNKNDFFEHYPTVSSRASLGNGADLLADHLQLEQQINELGWDAFRQKKLGEFRARMK